jgi:hypothetical protein
MGAQNPLRAQITVRRDVIVRPTCATTHQRRNETTSGTLSNIQKPIGIRINVRHST